jgi:hypothetical protein
MNVMVVLFTDAISSKSITIFENPVGLGDVPIFKLFT